jgi:hypothetical protein
MKILIVIVLIFVAFGAGVGYQRYKDHNQIVDISSQWRLSRPNVPNTPPQSLDPSGIAIWQCPSLAQGQNTTFYEPEGYTDGLSGCRQTGTAKIVLQLQ